MYIFVEYNVLKTFLVFIKMFIKLYKLLCIKTITSDGYPKDPTSYFRGYET